MKKIHVAGGALAGVLAVAGAVQSKNLQSNSPSAGGTLATSGSAASPGAGSQPSPGGAQAAGQLKFAADQKDVTLDLRPDQTAYTELRIVYEAIKPKEESGKEQKSPDAAEKKAKHDSATKKPAEKKQGDSRMDKAAPAAPAAPGNTGAATNQTGTLSSAPIPLKFNFDLKPFKGQSAAFSPCTTAVSPLVADSYWALNGPARPIPVNITSCTPNGGEGKLIIVNSSGERSDLKVTLNPKASPGLKKAVMYSLAAAVAVALLCAIVVWARGYKMRDEIGEVSWDFGSSWASNITVFGTALTFLLGLTAFPDKPVYGTKVEYTFLAGLAAALVAVAPAIQRMMSVGIASSDGESAAPATGFVGSFLTASAFTIWGALLQIAVSLLIVAELTKAAMIYAPIGRVVGRAIAVTGVGLIVYSFTTILATVHWSADATGTPAKKVPAQQEMPAQPGGVAAEQAAAQPEVAAQEKAAARPKRKKRPIAVL